MLYMMLAVTASAGARLGRDGTTASGAAMVSGAATRSSHLPGLALLFALLLAGYAVRDLDLASTLATGRRQRRPAVGVGPASAVAAAAATTTAPAGTLVSAVPTGLTFFRRPNRARLAEPSPAGTEPAGRVAAGTSVTGPAPIRELPLAPAVVAGCRIAMGITMAFMIISMV